MGYPAQTDGVVFTDSHGTRYLSGYLRAHTPPHIFVLLFLGPFPLALPAFSLKQFVARCIERGHRQFDYQSKTRTVLDPSVIALSLLEAVAPM